MSNKVSSNVRPTYRVAPKYPRRALSRRQKGWVKVQFIITANGRVKSPFVVSSKPSGVFDKAALRAIRSWKFKAKKVNGQAVAQRAVQTIQFKLR
ncbi:MAG: energy transducer TonB [Methylococcales bacterium]|nr:energy transducer TonB [Methylococcales bacterium]